MIQVFMINFNILIAWDQAIKLSEGQKSGILKFKLYFCSCFWLNMKHNLKGV